MPRGGFSGSLRSPKIDVVIDMGNPFLNRTVDGFLKIGACKVAAEETFDCLHREKKTSKQLLIRLSLAVCSGTSKGGLSENMERRPTCHVYNEIITCRAIFLNLEGSRSHGNERDAIRARGLGGRPPSLGARPGGESNQDSASGQSSTDLKDQSKPYNLCRFDPMAHVHLRGL
uniref:Amino acid selective channel protein n=1 Tax=Sorghum bicolor TaxID=4558 RepID=B3VTC0_SORBI|nr:amino acid selective channel protein [Sorghum bicolor]